MSESMSAPVQLPVRKTDAHKGSFGRALLVGGSRGMSGSIALSSIAALKTGSGLVTSAVPDRCLESVAAFHPCLMTVPLADDGMGRFSLDAASELASHSSSVNAIGCGPGMTTRPGSLRIVERLLQTDSIPRVIDADAINSLSLLNWPDAWPSKSFGPLVLTPHPGEFERLVGVSAKDRSTQIQAAKRLADAIGCIIVLKGGPTVVIRAGEEWTNSTGNPGMATGGSGDVLTGIITSLLGQGMSEWDATRLAVWVHGRAGDLAASRYGQAAMTALEILGCLPDAMLQISTEGGQ